jgi:hypothetical protein
VNILEFLHQLSTTLKLSIVTLCIRDVEKNASFQDITFFGDFEWDLATNRLFKTGLNNALTAQNTRVLLKRGTVGQMSKNAKKYIIFKIIIFNE